MYSVQILTVSALWNNTLFDYETVYSPSLNIFSNATIGISPQRRRSLLVWDGSKILESDSEKKWNYKKYSLIV